MDGKYIVFDVETPNSRNNRISSIGVSVVENGVITQDYYSLVNPEAEFNYFNVALTGITPDMVADKPNFEALWETLMPMMEGGVLVAHNAPFDMGVLSKCLMDYGIVWHRYVKYACTVRMGRRALPQLPNHKLNTISDYLGLTLDHHNAASDTHACAEILLYCQKNGVNIADFTRNYDLIMRRTLR